MKNNWVCALKCHQCGNIEYFLVENIWQAIAMVINNKGRHSCPSCKETGEVNIYLIKS